jgi:hypothetical protein
MTGDVLPVDDLIEHAESDDCLCGPAFEPVEIQGGGIGWIRVHHSLDGRELKEQE